MTSPAITWRALALASALFWAVGVQAFGEALPPMSCPHFTKQEIVFSDPDRPDTLYVDIIGADCETADISIVIQPINGRVIYAFRASAASLMNGEEFDEPMGVQLALDFPTLTTVLSDDPLWHGTDPIETGMTTGIYELDIELLARVRAEALPIFRHTTGCRGSSRDFVFVDGEVVQLSDHGGP